MTPKPRPPKRRAGSRRKLRRNSGPKRRQSHGGALQTGNPGNVGGGRDTNEFKEACRAALTRVDAAGIAESIAKNKRKAARDRLAALAWLADRGYGKATQPVSGPEGGPIHARVTVHFA